MLKNVQIITKDDGQRVAVAIGYSKDPKVPALLADETYPTFPAIIDAWLNDKEEGFADLFDIPTSITKSFSRLSERVTVKDDSVFFDGDEVHGHIVDTILSLMNAGEDVGPVVALYEKLDTNPLGNVKDGLFTWITGQKAEGNFTITQDGNVLGYKSVTARTPEWRTEHNQVFTPSKRSYHGDIVNDVEVQNGKYIEQVVGDTVEMPRSKVLNAPSQQCGDGLHIGTYKYAKGFTGDTVLLVEFDPRDIVSLPDSNSSWKLRVCRYKVLGTVEAPLETPLYLTEPVEPAVTDEDLDLAPDLGLNALDLAVEEAEDDLAEAEEYLDSLYLDDNATDDDYEDAEADVQTAENNLDVARAAKRSHGVGGRTSQAAKGRGRNPNQDAAGKFSAGRPGSKRDAGGKFAPKR